MNRRENYRSPETESIHLRQLTVRD